MISLVLFLSGLFVVLGIGAMAAFSDFKGLIIPNVYSVVIFGVFFVVYGALWLLGDVSVFKTFVSHLLGFAVVFVSGFILFALKVWGAGDQKLSSAFAIWLGFSGVPVFLIYMSLFGGLLGIAALVLRKYKPIQEPAKDGWVDQVQNGAGKVPYGIAISLGALASFLKIGYLNLDTFRVFL